MDVEYKGNDQKFNCRNSTVIGNDNIITGSNNRITGHGNKIFGDNNYYTGIENSCFGVGNVQLSGLIGDEEQYRASRMPNNRNIQNYHQWAMEQRLNNYRMNPIGFR